MCPEPPRRRRIVTAAARHEITLELDAWAHGELEREAAARATTKEALAAYAIAYYLADSDGAERIARRTLPPQPGGEPPA